MTCSPTAALLRPRSSNWIAFGSWARVANGPEVSRQQTTRRRRPSRAVRARCRTNNCDGSSAPCKSSSTTSSGRLLAALSTSRVTASNVRTRASNDGCTPPTARSTTAPPPAVPSSSSARSTSCQGQYGGAPSVDAARPHAVRNPFSPAQPASSSTRRDLPTPGSPMHTTRFARPRWASSRHPSSRANSRSRPTSEESIRASFGQPAFIVAESCSPAV